MELSRNQPSGEYHESEVRPMFNTVHQNRISSSKGEIVIGKYLHSAWAAFAKDPVHGLERYKWSRYDPQKKALIRLGYKGRVGPNMANGSMYDADC
jgi:hypothetical protein